MLDEDLSNVRRYFNEDYDPKLSKIKEWAAKLKMKASDLVKELIEE